MGTSNCEAVCKSLPFTSQTNLLSVLEACSVCRRSVPYFAQNVALCNVGTRRDQSFELKLNFSDPDKVHRLKERLMFRFTLTLPSHGEWYIQDKNTCDYHI